MTGEISYEILQFGNEYVEVAFRKAQPIDTQNRGMELQSSSKVEFKPGIYTLKKGQPLLITVVSINLFKT